MREKTRGDYRWRRLLAWVRERDRHYREQELRTDHRFGSRRDAQVRVEIMGGVLAVMEAEMRRHRKAQRKVTR